MVSTEELNERALALLRVVLGVFFCMFAEPKVFGTAFTLHGGFEEDVRGFLSSGSAYPLARPFLAGILAHWATPVAFSVAYGELAIGLSLVSGVLSRVASVFGFALMMLLWVSSGYPGAHVAFWRYWGASEGWTIPALCFVVLAVGRTEEVWTVRSLWRRRRAV